MRAWHSHTLASHAPSLEVGGIYLLSCFTRALDAGHMEAARVLVNDNANVNAKDDQGLTPLLSAVKNDDVKFIAFLLQLGASPEAQDINLRNSLHYAAESGNAEAAQLLLDAKKSILHDVDVENQSPIHYAAKLGHVNVLTYL